MSPRDIRGIPPDALFARWSQDVTDIQQDIRRLFSFRRTFRDLAEVFQNNARLQDVGGYFWEWMRVNYAASALIRVRCQVDDQPNTVSLGQLLRELSERPQVVTLRRLNEVLGRVKSDLMREMVETRFAELWVRESHPDPQDDHISSEVVLDDLRSLKAATEPVARVASRNVAHRTRVQLEDLTVSEADAAFNAIEATLQRYLALLTGKSLVKAEPTPSFNTHEVFTFPWIENK